MLDIKTFREAKELQEGGVIASKIMRRLNISKSQYFKWCLLSEETFLRHLKNKKSASMENYREFIVSILKITPQICLRNKKCSAYEISSYLIYKYGVERARVYLHDFELSHFKKRALEIREELEDGRHK